MFINIIIFLYFFQNIHKYMNIFIIFLRL